MFRIIFFILFCAICSIWFYFFFSHSSSSFGLFFSYSICPSLLVGRVKEKSAFMFYFLVYYLIITKCVFNLSKSKIHIFICFLCHTKIIEYFNFVHSLSSCMLLSCILILVKCFFLNPVRSFIFIILFCALYFFLHLRPSPEITFFLPELFPLEFLE